VALASSEATTAALILFLVGLAFLAIGGFVFGLQPQGESSFVFVLCCVAFAFSYGVAYARNQWLGLLENLAFFVPSLIIHFFLVFPVRRSWFCRVWHRLLLYVPGGVLFVLSVLTALAIVRLDLLYVLYWAPTYQSVGALIGLGFLLYTFFTAKQPVVRQQLKWIVWGVGIAATLNVAFIIVERTGLLSASIRTGLIDLANWSVLCVPVAFAFSIARYRLFDIDMVINRSIVYVVLTILVVSSYYVLIRFLIALDADLDFASPLMVAIPVILLSVLLDPLRQQVQRIVDRVMYRHRPNYRQVLQDYSREMAASIDLDHLVGVLLHYLAMVTRSEGVQVFLLDSQKSEYERVAALGAVQTKGSISMQHSLVQSLMIETEIQRTPDTTGESGSDRMLSEVTSLMEQEAWVLCIPLRMRESLVGWVGFGIPRSGTLYPLDERRFLTALADQAAVAVNNAFLYRDAG
jgi:hypothetical protein